MWLRRVAILAAAVALTAGQTGAASAEKRTENGPHRIIAHTGVRPAGLPAPDGKSRPATVTDVYIGTFYIVNKFDTNYCLDAWFSDGGGNGNRVGLWQCNGGISEKWHVYDNGSSGLYWMKIINARSGRSLDYPASSGGANGWQYVLWDYVASSGQQYWPYWHNSTQDYEFSVLLGGGANVMDAFASDGGGNGNRVGNWSITGHPLQRWIFVTA